MGPLYWRCDCVNGFWSVTFAPAAGIPVFEQDLLEDGIAHHGEARVGLRRARAGDVECFVETLFVAEPVACEGLDEGGGLGDFAAGRCCITTAFVAAIVLVLILVV